MWEMTTPATRREFLDVKDMAAALGVSPKRVYGLIAESKLPATRVAGVIRTPRVTWRRWVDQHVEAALEDCNCRTRNIKARR